MIADTQSHHLARKNLLVAAGWTTLAFFISAGNDGLAKLLGSRLHPIEVTFLRFLFSAGILLPIGLWKGWHIFHTQRPWLHIIRGCLLFGGITLWCHGLNHVPLSLATTLNFTIPIFTLILAKIFLQEEVNSAKWTATLVGFLGVFIVLHPKGDFQIEALGLLLASGMFASLDIINKKFVIQESIVAMLFWGSLATALLGGIGSYTIWETPSTTELILFLLLGIGANGILFFLLKGFRLADASALAPFRYIELLFSISVGWLFFHEVPSVWTLLGAAVIIPSTLLLVRRSSQSDESAE